MPGGCDLVGDRRSQFKQTRTRSIAGTACIKSVLGGAHNVFRGREVRLTDPETDDVAALRPQLVNLRKELKGVIGSQGDVAICDTWERDVRIISHDDKYR